MDEPGPANIPDKPVYIPYKKQERVPWIPDNLVPTNGHPDVPWGHNTGFIDPRRMKQPSYYLTLATKEQKEGTQFIYPQERGPEPYNGISTRRVPPRPKQLEPEWFRKEPPEILKPIPDTGKVPREPIVINYEGGMHILEKH